MRRRHTLMRQKCLFVAAAFDGDERLRRVVTSAMLPPPRVMRIYKRQPRGASGARLVRSSAAYAAAQRDYAALCAQRAAATP